jgi:hypothetical protein
MIDDSIWNLVRFDIETPPRLSFWQSLKNRLVWIPLTMSGCQLLKTLIFQMKLYQPTSRLLSGRSSHTNGA